MRRFILYLFAAGLSALLLSGCAAPSAPAASPDARPAAPSPSDAPVTTSPMPSPTATPAVTVLDLSAAPGDAKALPAMLSAYDALETVDLSGWDVPFDVMDALIAAHPDTRFFWQFELLGRTLDSRETSLDLQNAEIADAADFAKKLSYLPDLTYADLSGSSLENGQMAALRERYPAVKFVWLIRVGNWEMRTDVRAFSAGNRKTFEGGRFLGGSSVLSSADLEPLRYCTDLIALDVGHMRRVTDISVVESLPKLRFLIIGMCGVTDITPIGTLTELEFLETFQNYIEDISPLLNLKKLRCLNCSTNLFTDTEVLSQLTQLERLWIIHSRLSKEEIAALRETLPACRIQTTGEHSASNGWRTKNELYIEMQKLFNLPAQDQ